VRHPTRLILFSYASGVHCDIRSLCGDEANSVRISASSELRRRINVIAPHATQDTPKAVGKS